MRQLRYFGLLFILAALIMVLPGCDNGTADKDDDPGQPPVTQTYSGVVYYGGPASATDDNYVFVSVYNVTARASSFAPQSGDSYAITVMTPDADGVCYDASSNIKSEGTITAVSGSALTFTTDSGNTFTGTLANGTLTLATVPNTSYTRFNLTKNTGSMQGTTSANPFGPYDTNGFKVSDGEGSEGGDTGEGGEETPPPATPTGTVQQPIKLVSRIVPQFTSTDNIFAPNEGNYYYEGMPVKLNNTFRVKVLYDDGTEAEKSSQADFYISPPYYEEGETYSITYIAEAANTSGGFAASLTSIPFDADAAVITYTKYSDDLNDTTDDTPTPALPASGSLIKLITIDDDSDDTNDDVSKGKKSSGDLAYQTAYIPAYKTAHASHLAAHAGDTTGAEAAGKAAGEAAGDTARAAKVKAIDDKGKTLLGADNKPTNIALTGGTKLLSSIRFTGDELGSYELPGITITARYPNTANAASFQDRSQDVMKNITFTNYPMAIVANGTPATHKYKVTVTVIGTATPVVVDVPLAKVDVYQVNSIAFQASPLLFGDDARFRSDGSTYNQSYFVNLLKDASLTVNYRLGNSTTTYSKSLRVPEWFYRSKSTYTPPPSGSYTIGTPRQPKLEFAPLNTKDLSTYSKPWATVTYDDKSRDFAPVYNNLVGLEVSSNGKKGTPLVMNGWAGTSQPGDDVHDFYDACTIMALYQHGEDETKQVKRDANEVNGANFTSFTLTSNVNSSLNEGGADDWSNKIPSPVDVSLTTAAGGPVEATINIGVINYRIPPAP